MRLPQLPALPSFGTHMLGGMRDRQTASGHVPGAEKAVSDQRRNAHYGRTVYRLLLIHRSSRFRSMCVHQPIQVNRPLVMHFRLCTRATPHPPRGCRPTVVIVIVLLTNAFAFANALHSRRIHVASRFSA